MRWSVMPRRLQAGGTSHGRTSRAGRQAGVRFSGGGGCRALGRPGQGTVDPFPVRFAYRWWGVQSGTAPLSSSSCPSSYPVW